MNLQDALPGTLHFGTFDDDTLHAPPGDHWVFGLAGDNLLTSHASPGQGRGVVGLIGGDGDDTYVAESFLTIIADSGGNDTLNLPAYSHDIRGDLIDERDLLLRNSQTGQAVLVLDFANEGRIETLVFTDGYVTLTDSDIHQVAAESSLVYSYYAQLQLFFGDYRHEESVYQAFRDIDLAMANVDWQPVFQRIADAQVPTPEVIAASLEAAVLPLLEGRARDAWDTFEIRQALENSQYRGIDPLLSAPGEYIPVMAREVIRDMALLYEAALGRAPDIEGLNYFVGDLRGGQSLQDVATSFYHSNEFRDQFDEFDDVVYVQQLYHNVLGRPGDAIGLRYWVEDIVLRDRSHADVLVSFAQSAENVQQAEPWLAGLYFDAGNDVWVF